MFHHSYSIVEMRQSGFVGQLKIFMKPGTTIHHGLAIQIQGNRREDMGISTQVV